MDSVVMKHEQNFGNHQNHSYGDDQWVEIANDHSPHQSPLHEFNGGFYMSPSTMDQMYNRPLSTSQPSNPTLYPLTLPQWPSQLTNPSEPDTNPPAQVQLRTPRPIAPVTTVPPVQSAPPAPVPIPAPPTGRRTLTDQDRRRMCQYHDEHPSIKQTEIGCK